MNRKALNTLLFSVFAISAVFLGCKKDKPALTVSEDKMIKIFYDLHTANYIIKKAPVDTRDSLAQQYTDQIFANHNVTKDEFEKNLKLLQKYPEYFSSFYKKLQVYSDSLMQQIRIKDQKPK